MPAAPASATLRHLEVATDNNPLARKLLVCTSMGEGRELLRALGRRRSWIGWEITTPRGLAMELVGPMLAADGLSVADPFEEQAAVEAALDRALDTDVRALRRLAEAPGFRQAAVNAVEALRFAYVDLEALARTGEHSSHLQRLLTRMLAGYQETLAEGGLVDTAAVLERALPVLEHGLAVAPDRVFLVPGLRLHGATGRLVSALLSLGAVPLRVDPVAGLEPPAVVWEPAAPAPLSGVSEGVLDGADLDLFAASGPVEEVREVLRRVMARGLRWDEVEIVATDPVVYGGALHAVAERVGIPVSYAVGLPVERTRPGRAAVAYFRWLRTGYPADELRRLLQSGDLRTPEDGPSGLRLARRLRSLRIGWGYGRYLPAIDGALERTRTARPRRGETEAEAEARVATERRELEALRSVLEPILACTPELDPAHADQRISPAELARGLHAFLERVAAADDPSATARDRLLTITDRVEATLTRPTEPAAAMALLHRHLEIRVPAPQREGAAPWVSAGGHVHLSDIDHGGHSARKATFVVGLDADRFPGAGLQDPLLPDALRRALDPEALPTAADRLAARRFALAACLARLRGQVTLSYSAWDPSEAREVAPAPVILEAYRGVSGRAEASFEDLHTALGDAASPVARSGAVDAVDLWFHALERDGILQDGTELVRAAYPDLDQGLRAAEALADEAATPYHGAVTPRPDALDPRRNPEIILSASGLEDLGTCGLRYFYKYALGVRAPDDPELDPDVWLDALDRGRLLHRVYEAALREAREAGESAGSAAFTDRALSVLDRESARMARELPPPGEAVRRRELRALRADVRSFARMMEGTDEAWAALELKFGLAAEPPAPLSLKGGDVRVRGAIDRVDRTGDGLVVVDYKTGGSGRYERRHGVFHGGRRLQNTVYAAVTEWALEERVARMEYHFPTRKGQNQIVRYRREEVMRGLGLIDRLLDAVAAGRFLPTEDPADCRFCDYAPICRHRVEGWEAEMPRADWAAARFAELPEYRERRETRAWEETFLAELEEHGPAS